MLQAARIHGVHEQQVEARSQFGRLLPARPMFVQDIHSCLRRTGVKLMQDRCRRRQPSWVALTIMHVQAVAGEDMIEDEEMMGGKDAAVKAAAKGKLLSHIVKRNVMQVSRPARRR